MPNALEKLQNLSKSLQDFVSLFLALLTAAGIVLTAIGYFILRTYFDRAGLGFLITTGNVPAAAFTFAFGSVVLLCGFLFMPAVITTVVKRTPFPTIPTEGQDSKVRCGLETALFIVLSALILAWINRLPAHGWGFAAGVLLIFLSIVLIRIALLQYLTLRQSIITTMRTFPIATLKSLGALSGQTLLATLTGFVFSWTILRSVIPLNRNDILGTILQWSFLALIATLCQLGEYTQPSKEATKTERGLFRKYLESGLIAAFLALSLYAYDSSYAARMLGIGGYRATIAYSSSTNPTATLTACVLAEVGSRVYLRTATNHSPHREVIDTADINQMTVLPNKGEAWPCN